MQSNTDTRCSDCPCRNGIHCNGYQSIENAPKDGTPIVTGHLVRYLPYKPQGAKQMGKAGRWQEWNGYGWSNIDWEPTGWRPAKQGGSHAE